MHQTIDFQLFFANSKQNSWHAYVRSHPAFVSLSDRLYQSSRKWKESYDISLEVTKLLTKDYGRGRASTGITTGWGTLRRTILLEAASAAAQVLEFTSEEKKWRIEMLERKDLRVALQGLCSRLLHHTFALSFPVIDVGRPKKITLPCQCSVAVAIFVERADRER